MTDFSLDDNFNVRDKFVHNKRLNFLKGKAKELNYKKVRVSKVLVDPKLAKQHCLKKLLPSKAETWKTLTISDFSPRVSAQNRKLSVFTYKRRISGFLLFVLKIHLFVENLFSSLGQPTTLRKA